MHVCERDTETGGADGDDLFLMTGTHDSPEVVGHVRLHVCGCVSHSKCVDTAASRIPLPQHQTPDLLHNQCESVRAAAEMQVKEKHPTQVSLVSRLPHAYHHLSSHTYQISSSEFLFFFVLANKALRSACPIFFWTFSSSVITGL